MATRQGYPRRNNSIPDIPDAGTQGRLMRRSPRDSTGRGSNAQRLAEAARRTPGEIATYVRDVVQDPLGEAATALSPLAGAGVGAARLPAATQAVRGGAAAARATPRVTRRNPAPANIGLREMAQNAKPSRGQVFRSTAGVGSLASGAGLLLAGEDAITRAPKQGDVEVDYIDRSDPGSSPPPALLPARKPGSPNTFTGRSGVTREVPVEPPQRERASAAPNTASEIQGITRRAVDTIDRRAANTRGRAESALLNPMGAQAELVRRLNNSQRSYMNRGSPQARRLAAQPYLDALGMAGAADMEGLRSGNDAVARGAADEAAAHEGFARRTDAAQQTNISADLAREEIAGRSYRDTLKLLADQEATEAARQQALNQRYDDYRKEWLEANPGDFDGATQYSSRMARQEGLVDERGVPVGRAAALQQSAEIERAVQDASDGGLLGLRHLQRRLMGLDSGDPTQGGSVTFDPDDWEVRGQNLGQRMMSRMLPDVRARDPIYRHRVTGQEVTLRKGDPYAHERAAAERDPGRFRRRYGD